MASSTPAMRQGSHRASGARLALSLILGCLGLACVPATAAGSGLTAVLDQINPVNWVHTASTNYSEHRYIATDLTEHPTIREAFQRSFEPVDVGANVSAAIRSDFHPINLAGDIATPLTIELTREIGSGQGIHPRKLLAALNPAVIAGAFVGGTAGDIAGAALQSTLASLGPVGAVTGMFLRPMMSFAGNIFGMKVGEKLAAGGSFKQSLAASLRDIDPARDGGQVVGSVVGGIVGQVLIPVPIIGGIIGSAIGGVVGTMIGSSLGKHGITGRINNAVKRLLGRWANWLDGGKDGGVGSGSRTARGTGAPAPTPESAGSSGQTTRASPSPPSPPPPTPRPPPLPSTQPERAGDEPTVIVRGSPGIAHLAAMPGQGPTMDDLPVVGQ